MKEQKKNPYATLEGGYIQAPHAPKQPGASSQKGEDLRSVRKQ